MRVFAALTALALVFVLFHAPAAGFAAALPQDDDSQDSGGQGTGTQDTAQTDDDDDESPSDRIRQALEGRGDTDQEAAGDGADDENGASDSAGRCCSKCCKSCCSCRAKKCKGILRRLFSRLGCR